MNLRRAIYILDSRGGLMSSELHDSATEAFKNLSVAFATLGVPFVFGEDMGHLQIKTDTSPPIYFDLRREYKRVLFVIECDDAVGDSGTKLTFITNDDGTISTE